MDARFKFVLGVIGLHGCITADQESQCHLKNLALVEPPVNCPKQASPSDGILAQDEEEPLEETRMKAALPMPKSGRIPADRGNAGTLPITNAEIAELLALQAEQATGHLQRAFKRAS